MKRWRVISGPLIFLLLWIIAHYTGLVKPIFLPSPQDVLIKIIELFKTGILLKDLVDTIYRTFIGFALGALIGIPLGLILGAYQTIYESTEVLVDFFRSIPGTALFPLFMLFFGIGDGAKIGNAVFACSLIILVNAMYGVRNANITRQEAAKAMGASRTKIFFQVTLPSALPEITGGLRIAVSISLIVIVVTEMFVGTEFGLGKRIYHEHNMFHIPQMYAAIIVTGLLGYALNIGLQYFEQKIVHWRGI